MNFPILRPFYLALALLIFTALPLPAQQLDAAFGTNGVVFAYLFSVVSTPYYEIVVKSFNLPDGSILAVVQVIAIRPKSPDIIAAYLVHYSNQGIVQSVIGSLHNFMVADAVQQPDGKIVAVGHRYANVDNQFEGRDWIVARFNANGTLDTSFNSTGFVTRAFAQNEDVINKVVLQPDGKIVVLGTSSNSANGTVTIVGRFNTNGSVDNSFGPYGAGFFDIYDGGSLSRKLILRPDGKFLLAGNSPPSGGDLILAQYGAGGAPDPNFGSGGFKIIDYGGLETLADAALQTDGKILVLANSDYAVAGANDFREQEIVLSRLNADGSTDNSFGTNGKSVINDSPPAYQISTAFTFEISGSESAQNIFLRPDGSILISGISRHPVSLVRKFVLTLFEFNSDGRLTAKNFTRRTLPNQLASTNGLPTMKGILTQHDGKILLYGTVNVGGALTSQVALARFSSLSAVADTNNFFDYNFDGRADYAIYRPNATGLGTWLFLRSRVNNLDDEYQTYSREYGLSGDIIAPGDYDGDYVQDLAVFRPSTGEWITRKIYLDNCAPMSCVETVQFGANGDIPAPGDFDGDGKTDRVVFRPGEGNWYVLFSSTGGYTGFHFGQNGDKPVTGDYDGDGKSDAAVIRRENGKIFWYISQSSNGAFVAFQFGNDEDKTVVADYNGDGKTEVAVWRPSNGTWYVLANYTDFSYRQFGISGDIPEPADYDGDRKADFVVFRPSNGVHSIFRSSDGTAVFTQYGSASDIPVASAYVR